MAKTTTPIAGLHCVLHRLALATTIPVAGTAVAQLTSIGDLEITRDTDEYHTYQDEWMKKIATTLSAGSMEFEAVYYGDDDDQAALRTALTAGTINHYAITYTPKADYANGIKSVFQGIVTNFSRMSSIDAKVMVKFTLDITGPITETEL